MNIGLYVDFFYSLIMLLTFEGGSGFHTNWKISLSHLCTVVFLSICKEMHFPAVNTRGCKSVTSHKNKIAWTRAFRLKPKPLFNFNFTIQTLEYFCKKQRATIASNYCNFCAHYFPGSVPILNPASKAVIDSVVLSDLVSRGHY